MKRFLALALLCTPLAAPVQAATPSVETADATWTHLPLMRQRSNDHLSNKAIARIQEIASSRQCAIPGVGSRGLLSFDMSFAAQFSRDGTLNRIVMPKLNCPEAEGILGGVLLKMVQSGDYRPDGSNEDGWYRGRLNFTVGS